MRRPQARFLNRQLSLPVSTISQWWVSRSSSAVVNLLVGSFIARLDKFRSMASTGLILIAMILIGFAMIWRSFML